MIFNVTAFSQKQFDGKVVDKSTGLPIPFASVGILGSPKGTSSNADGEFSIFAEAHTKIKITCVGYASLIVELAKDNMVIQLEPNVTQLNSVVVSSKKINPRRIVSQAFARISDNYSTQSNLQKFFYRHYCQDDSVYGRVIEAAVEVWKRKGYRTFRRSVGQDEELRVTQIRRSLDKTLFSQGHEPIALKSILQSDVIAYQTADLHQDISFHYNISDLKLNADQYTFSFDGISSYDGKDVYRIGYTHNKDSALTTAGNYILKPFLSGTLYITTDTYALVRSEEEKKDPNNTIRTSSYYRQHESKYYPYHFIREGTNSLSGKQDHHFRIELISVDILNTEVQPFQGDEPTAQQLLQIPYDSVFWASNLVLKTTPLEDKIIHDLGGGVSLNKQFYLYRQYQLNTTQGGVDAEEKFNWLLNYSRNRKPLYLIFWSSNFKNYLVDMELAKRLYKRYRNDISFVLLSLDDDPGQWQQAVAQYNFFSDGIINYRIGSGSTLLKNYKVKELPKFVSISKSGETVYDAKAPSNNSIENDFRLLISQ